MYSNVEQSSREWSEIIVRRFIFNMKQSLIDATDFIFMEGLFINPLALPQDEEKVFNPL